MSKTKETEQRVIEMISRFDEEYFDAKIAGDPQWALSYHLCSLRCGLLNWYDFRGENALDIGAGFGALTGILCDHFTRVDAVEYDSVRADALRMRYKHRDGLTVHTLDIREYTPDVLYDCILIVDFAEEYEGDFTALLKQALSWLKEDGVILLGLRNRAGMKYTCGMKDEYMQEPFGQYKNTSLYTRQEIVQLLEHCGISDPFWYYPLPDSRYAQIVYSEEDMPEHSVRDRIIVYDPFDSPVIFDENDLLDHVLSERNLPEQANDYLLEIRRKPGRNRRHIVSAVISADREHERAYKTLFYNDHSVEKRALYPEGVRSLKQSAENHEVLRRRGIPVIEQEWREDHLWMPRAEGITLQDKLVQVLKSGDIPGFYTIVDRLYQLILQSDPESVQGILKSGYIDMIPLNAFWINDQIVFFDQEFTRENCPAGYILCRAIFYLWVLNPDLEKILPRYEVEDHYGLTEKLAEYRAMESAFVGENRQWMKYSQYYGWSAIQGKIAENRQKLIGHTREDDLEQVRRIHEIQLDMLKKFDEVCRKYDLRYFAVHGTLLGAVRHQGFIPWDDDMDLAMPRKDYDKLCEVSGQEFTGQYFFQTPENDPECFYGGYGKLRNENTSAMEWQNQGHDCHQGIWIDILPLDHVPETDKKRELLQRNVKRRQKLLYAKIYPNWANMISDVKDERVSLYYLLSGRISHAGLCRMLYRILTSCKETGWVGILACYYKYVKNRNIYRKEETENLIEVPFEDTRIPIPAAYDTWLKDRYGENYMAYPSEEYQKIRHSAAFDTEISYKEKR